MVKFFKIIEKIVWIIAALTIAAVLAMVFIGAFANLNKAQFDWSSYIPYFYGAAAVVVLYKIVVLYYTSFYQTEIDEKTGMLVSLDDEIKGFVPIRRRVPFLMPNLRLSWKRCNKFHKLIQMLF